MTLFMLVLTDPELSYDGHSEDFLIGFFETRAEAQETAAHYLARVKGFCEHPVTSSITEIPIADGGAVKPQRVWIAEGWNTNDDFDEVDVIMSDCFVSKALAAAEMTRLSAQCPRSNWAASEYAVGETEWGEGFAREAW